LSHYWQDVPSIPTLPAVKVVCPELNEIHHNCPHLHQTKEKMYMQYLFMEMVDLILEMNEGT